MNCFAEATYAMFADGELSPPKVVKVQAHLATCLRCRELVAALKAENRVLSSAFSIAVEEKTTLDDGAVATKFFRVDEWRAENFKRSSRATPFRNVRCLQ